MHKFLNNRIACYVADITTLAVDVIVNAANSRLLGGGGVDGAIHRAGGPAILDACKEIRATAWPDGLPTGEAVITTAGDLPSKYVIHTVGPIYGDNVGREAKLLAACYLNAIRLALSNGAKTIAFPAISTGVYGYPENEAAQVVSATLEEALTGNDLEVHLVFFSESSLEAFIANQAFH